MYSTKLVHKMSGAQFLGGKYLDKHKAENTSARFQGKQFSVLHPKQGNPSFEGVLFSRLSNEKVKSDPYSSGNSYLKSHPLENRKLGFGTHDAPKKDEFLSSQRAEQHKQSMKSDEAAEREAVARRGPIDEQIARLHERLNEIDEQNPGFKVDERNDDDYVRHVPAKLYDIGRSEQGTTSSMLSDTRDQFYSLKRCQKSNKPRHVQRLSVSSNDYGLRSFNCKHGEKIITLGPKGGNNGKFLDSGHLRVSEHED